MKNVDIIISLLSCYALHAQEDKVYRFLEDALEHLEQVYKLDLSKKEIMVITETIGLFTNLEELNLSENRIFEPPKTIGKLSKSKRLSIDRNQLKSLPASFGQLKTLTMLSLKGNPLIGIKTKDLEELFPNCRIYY